MRLGPKWVIVSLLIGAIVAGGSLAWWVVSVSRPTIEEVIERNQAWLMEQEGVVGVGIGEVDGKPCIKIYVEEKTPQLEQAIPEEIEGFKVVIEEVGEIVAGENNASVVENGIMFTISVEKLRFYPWENIDVTLKVKNERENAVTLAFRDAQIFDLFVYNENFQKIYTWSHNKVFAIVITEIALAPGDNYSQSLSWDNRASDEWGTYYVRGSLVSGWWDDWEGPERGTLQTPLLKILVIPPSQAG